MEELLDELKLELTNLIDYLVYGNIEDDRLNERLIKNIEESFINHHMTC